MEFKDISTALGEVAAKYHIHRPLPQLAAWRDWLVHLWRLLDDFLRRFGRHSPGAADSRSISVLLEAAIVLCAAIAFVTTLFLLVKHLALRAKERAQSLKGAAQIDAPLAAAKWKQRADQLAKKQDYRGACRATYLSVLQSLDERGIAPFAPTKTNYEYGYALSKYPQLQEHFRQFADLVDTLWFGNKQARQDDYLDSCRLQSQLEASMINTTRSSGI